MKKRVLSQKNFTIIEMIIVIAVLVILMSLISPSLQKVIANSEKLSCSNVKRQYSTALQLYTEDFNGFFVPIKTANGWNQTSWNSNIDFRELLGIEDHSNLSIFPEFLKCPSVASNAAGSNMRPNFYGFNVHGHRMNRDYGLQIKGSAVNHPGHVIQLIEGTDWYLRPSMADYVNRWDIFGQFRLWSVAYRHQEGANILFFDGHVEYRLKEDVWLPGQDDKRDRQWRINPEAGYSWTN